MFKAALEVSGSLKGDELMSCHSLLKNLISRLKMDHCQPFYDAFFE